MAYKNLNLIQNFGLILIIGIIFVQLCSAQTLTPEEQTAMDDLSAAMNPSPWAGNTGIDPCLWEGVACISGHIQTLFMNFTTGPYSVALPASLSGLAYLQNLYIYYATFTAPFPNSLSFSSLTQLEMQFSSNVDLPTSGSFPMLQGIAVWFSNLTKLPDLTLYSRLTSFTVTSCLIDEATAFIPTSYGSINGLSGVYLTISSTNLGGTIPAELGNAKIDSLILASNKLVGTIPPQLGNMPLNTLMLSGNQLNGTIPVELGNIPNLETLQLGNNNLTGTIPSGIFTPVLQTLFLQNNLLTDPFPDTSQATSLLRLVISNNLFAPGPIPVNFYGIPSLTMFLASGCKFTGTIPIFAGKIDYLELANNQLTGSIPQFTQSTALLLLDLSGNSLTGVIPDFVLKSSSLMNLRLAGNSLAGCVTSSNFLFINSCSLSGNVMCCANGTLPCDADANSCLTCNSAKPSDSAVCMYDDTFKPVWLVSGDVVITNTSGPVENTVINGNLQTTTNIELNNVIINGNLSVVGQLSVSNGIIDVRGCAYVNASLVLNLTPEEAQQLAANGTLARDLITIDAACSTNDVTFDQITVNGGVSTCAETTGKQSNSPGLVTIIITEQKLSCNTQEPSIGATALPDWAIAVIVVGCVVVAGAIITGVLVARHLQLKKEGDNVNSFE